MKLKNIFTALLAGLTLFTACDKNEDLYLSEVRVSSSYIAIPIEGGNQEITITANDSWSINLSDKDAKWLTVSPVSGEAGDTKVVFSAAAGTSTNSTTLKLVCAGKTQLINVLQQAGKVELPISKSTEVNASEDGTMWRIKGTVRGIENTTYGNYYIDDEWGSVYVYGTLNNGESKKFASLGIEAGDIITVQGKKGTYNGPQLVDVDVIAIEKSLIKIETIDPADATIAKEGGEVKVALTVKGDGASAIVPEEAKSWLSVSGIQIGAKETVVTLSAAANAQGDRATEVSFVTTKDGKTYSAVTKITQKGAVIDADIATILAAEDGLTQYRVSGYVSKVDDLAAGKIYIKDATGDLYLYKVSFGEFKVKAGDIITVVGAKGSYNGKGQLVNAAVEAVSPVTDIDLAGFRALADDKTTYYRISGKVAKSTEENTRWDIESYGNFALTDGTTEVYVYGVRTGWGGEKGKFGTLGVKEGDELTIVCYKTSFKGLVEADGCFYVSHKSSSDSPEQPVDPQPAESETIAMSDCFPADANTNLEDGKTYTWGSLSVKFTKNNTSGTSNYNVKDGGLRFYASDVMTISAEKDIVKLEFVTYGSKKGPFTANVGKVEVPEGDVTVVWTGETKSVELTAENQIRIKEIKVTYKK